MALSHKDNVTKLFSQKNFPWVNCLAYFAFVSDKESLMVSSHMRQHYKTFFSKKLSPGKWSSLLCSFVSNEEKVLVALSHKDNFTKPFSQKKLSRGKQSSLLCSFASNEEKSLVAL